MTMGDLILVALALLIGTILALSGGCMFNTNIGSGDFSLDKEAPYTEVLTNGGDIK